MLMIEDVFVQLVQAVRAVVFYLFVLDILVIVALAGVVIGKVCRWFGVMRRYRAEIKLNQASVAAQQAQVRAYAGGGGRPSATSSYFVGGDGKIHSMPQD